MIVWLVFNVFNLVVIIILFVCVKFIGIWFLLISVIKVLILMVELFCVWYILFLIFKIFEFILINEMVLINGLIIVLKINFENGFLFNVLIWSFLLFLILVVFNFFNILGEGKKLVNILSKVFILIFFSIEFIKIGVNLLLIIVWFKVCVIFLLVIFLLLKYFFNNFLDVLVIDFIIILWSCFILGFFLF